MSVTVALYQRRGPSQKTSTSPSNATDGGAGITPWAALETKCTRPQIARIPRRRRQRGTRVRVRKSVENTGGEERASVGHSTRGGRAATERGHEPEEQTQRCVACRIE
eukprot:scaffold29872_cov146-Isochrysis_galbana.AAC.1